MTYFRRAILNSTSHMSLIRMLPALGARHDFRALDSYFAHIAQHGWAAVPAQ